MSEALRTAETAVCPGCDHEVRLHHLLDVETPYGTVSLCRGCHPNGLEAAVHGQEAGGD